LARFQQEPLELAAVHPDGPLADTDGWQLSVLDQIVGTASRYAQLLRHLWDLQPFSSLCFHEHLQLCTLLSVCEIIEPIAFLKNA
jgi:hypothetical protein